MPVIRREHFTIVRAKTVRTTGGIERITEGNEAVSSPLLECDR